MDVTSISLIGHVMFTKNNNNNNNNKIFSAAFNLVGDLFVLPRIFYVNWIN